MTITRMLLVPADRVRISAASITRYMKISLTESVTPAAAAGMLYVAHNLVEAASAPTDNVNVTGEPDGLEI
jgi:hypothetical protein